MTSRRLRARVLTASSAAALVWAGVLAATPATDDDLARRTFANADQLLREGKVEQALKDFEQVYTAYPDSAVADDALDRIGSYYYPVETVDALGTVPDASILKARDLFQRIKARYPGSDRAPRALLKLGLIALDPHGPQRSLDEAYAAFSGVANIYPASAEVDRALFGAGYADLLAGRYDKSIASFERVAEEYPGGAVAEDALYHMGLAYARQGLWVRALEQLQATRNLRPGGRLASRALDRATSIYKLKMQPGLGGRPLFALDPSFAPVLPPDAARAEAALAVDDDSAIHLLDARTGALMRLDHAGKLVSTGAPQPGAVSIAVDRSGAELLAAGARLRNGTEIISPSRQEGSQLRALEKIAAAVRVGAEEIAFLDEEHNELLLYSGDPAKPKLLYHDPAGRARLTGLAVGAAGKLYTIDRRGRRVIEVSADGAVREIAPTGDPEQALQEPIGLAADELGDLFVLDRRAAAVVIMSADGRIIDRIASQPGAAGDFSSATALAVGPRAEIYIHDAKRRTILRFW